VHGGITFADGCAEITEERWVEFRAREADWRDEARRYPQGDSARKLREWGLAFENYKNWSQRMRGTAICHLPTHGEPDDVWWAHAGDYSPRFDGDRLLFSALARQRGGEVGSNIATLCTSRVAPRADGAQLEREGLALVSAGAGGAREAYRRELDHFIGAIASGAAPLVGGGDGVKALALADAGLESLRTGRAVRV
jgi:hypothetical protein